MHPWRRHILFRWLIAAVVILALGGHLAYKAAKQQPRPLRAEMPEIELLELPTAGDLSALNESVEAVNRLALDTPRLATAPDPSLLDAEGSVSQELEAAGHSLALIFLGEASRFADLDGKIYTTGQATDQGATIQRIERDSVRLVSGGISETVYWIEPMRVSLTRPSPPSIDGGLESEADVRNAEQEQEREENARLALQSQEAMPETIREAVREKDREAEEPQINRAEDNQ